MGGVALLPEGGKDAGAAWPCGRALTRQKHHRDLPGAGKVHLRTARPQLCPEQPSGKRSPRVTDCPSDILTGPSVYQRTCSFPACRGLSSVHTTRNVRSIGLTTHLHTRIHASAFAVSSGVFRISPAPWRINPASCPALSDPCQPRLLRISCSQPDHHHDTKCPLCELPGEQ